MRTQKRQTAAGSAEAAGSMETTRVPEAAKNAAEIAQNDQEYIALNRPGQ